MKILLLTSIYPIPDVPILGGTSVCHYFAKEWVAQGHEVLVINTYTVYHPLLHTISKKLGKFIASRFASSINTTRFNSTHRYELDGVQVALIPTYKPFPRLSFPKESIISTSNEILSVIKDQNFIPDVVTAHFLHPNLELIPFLKKTLDRRMGITLHGKIDQRQVNEIAQNYPDIDFWGFRSYPIMKSFITNIDVPTSSFMCFSGIPESYVKTDSYKKHQNTGVNRYLYVGNLSKRKYPSKVLEALTEAKTTFKLGYVGSGDEERIIKSMANRLGVKDNIRLYGRVDRENVTKIMEESECFIMISAAETFGLVYLEAMAKGCLVVASRNEGMDGLIQDGVNGFLCEAGSSKELAQIIQRIDNMTPEEKIIISKNAIETAKAMTDKLMSDRYLEFLTDQQSIIN